MMRSPKLWQRNVIGAVVAVAVLVVLWVTELEPKWADYRSTVEPKVVVPPRETAAEDNRGWSIGEVRHLGRGIRTFGTDLPPGTVVMVVTVHRTSPLDSEPACLGVLTDGEHRWRGEPLSRYNIKMAPDATLNCSEPGPLQWAFVLPDDVVPTAVDITRYSGSIEARLQL